MTRPIVDEEIQKIIYDIFSEGQNEITNMAVYPKLKALMFQVYSINTHELDMLSRFFGDMNIRLTADVKTAMIRVLIQEGKL